MQKSAFLYLALGLLLAACEKEVAGIKLPESDAKLVVQCFISPQDDYLTAFVSRSVPVLGPANPADIQVQDATVALSDGVRSVRLSYDASQSAYIHRHRADGEPFNVVPGKVYSLRVTTPQGEVVTAACTVPAAPPATIVVSADSARDDNKNRYYYRMRVIWPDPPDQVNYYRVDGYADATTEQTYDGEPTAGIIVPAEWEASAFIRDEGRDGVLMVSPWGNCRDNTNKPFLRCLLYASVLHTDEHYYRYHHSVRRARQSQDNPFAEPVLVYSNTEGGLGIFAAFTQTTSVVQIK
jgi:hypothetical protein